MADLVAIYEQLEAMSVSVGIVTPDVFGLDEAKNSIDTAHLPCRLMLLSSSNRAEGTNYDLLTIQQNAAGVRWRIADLLLWEAQGQGSGIHDHDPDLALYMGNYASALLGLGGPGFVWRVENASIRPGVYEWPLESNHWFFGVLCEMEVYEVDP